LDLVDPHFLEFLGDSDVVLVDKIRMGIDPILYLDPTGLGIWILGGGLWGFLPKHSPRAIIRTIPEGVAAI
jgi:hypothetical protein